MEKVAQEAKEAIEAVERQEGMELAGPVAFEKLEDGQAVAQGDLLIIKREDKLWAPSWNRYVENREKWQLAPGNSPGSRHIIREEDRVHVRLFWKSVPLPTEGPWVEARGPWTLTHPEHAWITFPAGTFEVRHQREFTPEEERGYQRLKD